MNSFIDSNSNAMTLNSLNSMNNVSPVDQGLSSLSTDDSTAMLTASSFSLQISAVPSLYYYNL